MININERGRIEQCCNMDSIMLGYWQKLLSMFKIINLPPEIKPSIWMSWLFATGMLGMWRDGGRIRYGCAGYCDNILEDGTSSRVLLTTYTTVDNRSVDDTGIIWLNSMRTPLWDLVMRYTNFTREGDKSLRSELFNIRSCKVPTARTDAEKRQLDALFTAQKNGVPYIPKIPMNALGENENTPVMDLGDGRNTHNLSELMDFRQRIVAEYDTQLGIGVFDGLKRERMITGELNNLKTSSRINVQDMFDRISEGLDDCNKKLGLDMCLEWGECYKVENVENVSRETIEGGDNVDS